MNAGEPKRNLSKFEFLNSDWEWTDNSAFRDRCEAWFQRIPEGKHASLRGKFRSKDDAQHNGAFFELFLHELFTVLGCGVEFEPSIGDKTPDFLLTSVEASTIVEATVAGHSSNPFDLGPNEQRVLDYLDTLTSPHFYILYDVENAPNNTLQWTTPSAKYVTHKIKKLLADNDPMDVRKIVENFGRKAAPSQKLEWRDGTMTVWLSPKPADSGPENEHQGIVLSRMNAERIDPFSSVREALTDKAGTYSNLGVPLIVAVNAANPFFSLDGHALNVLWGDLSAQYGTGTREQLRYVRQPNGFWDKQGRRSSNIAGVLFLRNADVQNVFQASASLHVNPHYCNAELPNALLRLPHCVPVDGRPVRKEGENVAQLLGVSWK